jgi:hypothetical protein
MWDESPPNLVGGFILLQPLHPIRMSLHRCHEPQALVDWREEILAYEHTSHPPNLKDSTPYKFVATSLQFTWTLLVGT